MVQQLKGFHNENHVLMKYFKLKYKDGSFDIVKGANSLDVIKKYDLATKKHIETNIIELQGEQLVIAISNDQ